MNDIKKKLDEIFYVVLKVPKSKKKTHLNFKNVKKWDSLNHINLILAIESSFKVKVTPEENLELITYKKIYTFLNKNL